MRGIARSLFVLLLLLGFLMPTQAWAGGDAQVAGARRVGLGFAYTAVRADFWSLFMNPAGIAGIQQMEVGAFAERRFLLQQLNYATIGFATPFKNGKHFAGLDVTAYGFNGYSESRVGLTYATTLFERLSLGAKVNYTRFSIPNYGAKAALYADVGINCILSKHINVGFRIFNASRSELQRDQDEKIPTTLDAGLAYKVSDKVLIVADVEKQVNFPISFRGGVEYAIAKFLTDPVWWFYLYWVPPYLFDVRHMDLKQIGWALPVIYLMADFGSVGGGWLSGFLMRRGWPNGKARKAAMGLCAGLMPVAALAVLADGPVLAIGLISIATAAHQGWSANLYTTASDVFPKAATASITGIGGCFGGLGGVLFSAVIPGYVVTHFGYKPMFLMLGAFHLTALIFVHKLLGDMRPLEEKSIR